MRRKVIKHGPSTLIISLPSKWVKSNNVARGTELEVLERGGTLTISANGELEKKPQVAELDVSGLERTSILYAICGLYRLGCDTIVVKFKNPVTKYSRTGEDMSVLSVIHREVNRLVGFEVIEERETMCVIKDLETVSDKDFDNVLRRIFLLLMDTLDDFVRGAKTLDLSMLGTIEQKHDTITKFVSYCIRILNKKGGSWSPTTLHYFFIIATLDRIADIIKYAARDMRECKSGITGKSAEILDLVNQSVRRYYELFYKFDKLKLEEINSSRYRAEKILKNLPDTTKTRKLVVIASTFQILEILLHLIEARVAMEQQNQAIKTVGV